MQTLCDLYPYSDFVCALGGMDATQEGSKWPGYIEAAVAKIKGQEPAACIDTLFFEFTGYGQHPRVEQHLENAEELSSFIAE